MFLFFVFTINVNALNLNGIYGKIDSIAVKNPSKIETIYKTIVEVKKKFKESSGNYIVLNDIENYLSIKIDDINKIKEVERIKQEEEIEKQEEIIALSKIPKSSNERPIGTVEITAKNYSVFSDSNLVYEIITTNNIVKGYELAKNLKTGEIDKYFVDKLQIGYYDKITGEIYLAYHRWKYEYIKEDLMTFSNTIIIKGEDVYDKYGNKIGIFYPNQLHKFTTKDIPLTQGCTDIWTDNSVDKIYYTKESQFFNDIFDKKKYNYHDTFFCSEEEAIKNGYTKSLN